MSAHQFGSRGDRILVWTLGGVLLVGLAASALVPGVEAVLDLVAFVGLGALVVLGGLGWVIQHLIGEYRLERECRCPEDELRPLERETCMVRQVTREEYKTIMKERQAR